MANRTCRWPECGTEKILGWGLCGKHYHRSYRLGNFDDPWREWDLLYPAECIWPGCNAEPWSRKMCARDYYRAKLVGTFDRPWDAWVVERICERCGETFTAHTRATRFCSGTCARSSWRERHPEIDREHLRASNRRRRAAVYGAGTERLSTEDVRMSTGDTCYLCSEPIDFRLRHPDPLSPSMDHIVPLARGGKHTLENTAMVHLRCNLKKHAKRIDAVPMATLLAP